MKEFFVELITSPAKEVSITSDLGIKIASLESSIKHQEILLGNITLELHELRKTNDELSKELARLRLQEACSEVNINNINKNSLNIGKRKNNNIIDELGDKIVPPLPPLIDNISHQHPLHLQPLDSSLLQPSSVSDGAEVVRDGELIISNFIDGKVDNYNKVAYAVLRTLDPSITISDITLARPLSLIKPTVEQINLPRSRIAVTLSSPSLVSRVLQAKSRRTGFCTDDLDLTMLGCDLSTRVKKHCKIFINEALSKERFKLFCNLKSAAKNLGIKYVWHRGGRFMARARGLAGNTLRITQ